MATILSLYAGIVKERQTNSLQFLFRPSFAGYELDGLMTDTLKLLLLSSVFAFSPSAFAQEGTDAEADTPDEIVVTASRRPQNISDIGASISVIGEEALERGQYSFVLDALQTLPGVAINQNGGFGGQASVSIRGAATAQTVILIDGVQMNDVSSPGGSFNFGTLDPAGIERIEVLRGPQAVLYGSDAIGGVVNIITKTGGETAGSAFIEYGAFDTFRGGGTLSGGTGAFGFNLSASGIKSDGISKADADDGNAEADGYEAYTLRGRITVQLSDAVEFEAFTSYSDSETDTDSFGPVDGPDMALSEDYLVGGRIHVGLLGGKLANTLSVEYSGIDRASVSAFGTFDGKGERFNLDYLGVYTLDENWSLSAGAQHESVKAETASTESFSTDSVFGVIAYSASGINLSAGLRVDDHESFGTTTNGQMRASYNMADTGTRVFANWGEGFKAPSVFQLTFICGFCGLTAPNANLLPERSNAWEAGFEQRFMDGRAKFTTTYFEQKINDLIDFSFTAGYDNIAAARLKGVEIGFDFALADTLSFNTNYTNTSAKDRSTDTQLIRRPKNQFYAGLDWQMNEKFSTNISLTHNGSELDSGDRTLESWSRVDVRAAYKVSENIELYGRIDNLFDTTYQQVIGYGTPGISSFFGVRGSF